MDDSYERGALVEQLCWIMQSCTTLSVAVQEKNPDVNLEDLCDMFKHVVPPLSDFMIACFGDGEANCHGKGE